ncbi:SLATT domain-containing protein [Sphingomonas sp. Leaf28]|uniref:SLATT domain-containing protein n=1 Tax=Sphingomonas sp. Leaf28 TaxID=1735695 RepID=UPI0012E14292|nr:SLATT domain-containing protein [Sphingomonas sp. Leaf28]
MPSSKNDRRVSAEVYNDFSLPPGMDEALKVIAIDRLSFALRGSDWYRRKKRRLQWASKILRIGSISLITSGGVAPLLAKAELGIDPYIGYILLALGGSLLLGDRVFGVSAGWARFMKTAMSIEALAESFRVRIIGMNYENGSVPMPDLSKLCLDFTQSISNEMRSETDSWISEFNNGQDELRNLTKTRSG